MRKGLIALLAVAGMAAIAETAQRTSNVVEGRNVEQRKTMKRRKTLDLVIEDDCFPAYASFRKGKGQKKRERSQRHSKGW